MAPARWFAATAAVLLLYNVARAVGVFGSAEYVGVLILILVMVGIWWRAGLGAADVGLAREHVRSGLAYGGTAFTLVVVVVGAAAALPATAGFFDDSRVDVSASGMVFEVVVGILLLTAIPEELAFRGVLLATGTQAWGARRAAIFSSVLFGLWHISPTLTTMTRNDRVSAAQGQVGASVGVVAASVAITFVAGLLFCWLRRRSESLVAPIIAHLATNGVAFVVAWAIA